MIVRILEEERWKPGDEQVAEPNAAVEESDLLHPGSDATIEEVWELLSGESSSRADE